ncbi:MAG: DPP IV N-terminal domain-containing protein [Bacteroidota bacterium]
MNRFLLLIGFFIASGVLVAQNTPVTNANYELASRFSPTKVRKMVFSTSVSPHWLKNSDRFWYEYETSEGKNFYIVDPEKKTKALLFDRDKMAADISRLTLDPFDGKHIPIRNMKFVNNENAFTFEIQSKLVEVEEEMEEEEGDTQDDNKAKNKKKPKMVPKVWKFEYNLQTKELKLIDYKKPDDRMRWASINPDSSYVVFARHHNLYWMDKENFLKALKDEKDSTIVEHQLTTDGEEHYSYARGGRGQTVSQIEKDKDKRKPVSIVWSPDFKSFAMTRSDVREVKDLFVINSIAQPRPTLEVYKYNMPGEKEAPQVELMYFNIPDSSRMMIKADTFKDQTISIHRQPWLKKNYDDDFNVSHWLGTDPEHFYFARTSRDLKRIDVCKANIKTGDIEILIEERLNTYIDYAQVRLVNGGKELIHWSERDGWGHFYLYDDQGNVKNQITSGPFHCDRVETVDEKNRVLYFVANGREEGEDPYYYHLYRVNFDGTGLQLLNKGNYSHTANMNDNARFFISNFSRVDASPKSELRDSRGNLLIDLETADLSQLMAAGYKYPEPFKAKAADGITDIYGVMYKPFNFDSTKLYPLIEYVYPGPQTEAVAKTFSRSMDRTDRMAQLGFVVITLGNRGGHPDRSKWYHNYGYGNLRDYGLADKKSVAEQLAARHNFIDIDKVGIFGHSGGGFMSTAAMLVYPDFFKVAVSSSGNHVNEIYNRWWSEKHHGVKEIKDDKGNVTFKYDIDNNVELAKNLKGKLMITTGDIDNNVNPALTIRMAHALIKANKRFDYFVFPGQRHGYGNMNEYFFWLRGEYFCKHLLGDDRSDSADYMEMQREQAMKR